VDVETLISRHHQASDGLSDDGRPASVEATSQGAASRAEPPTAEVAPSVQAAEQAEPAPSAEPANPPEVEELAKIVSGAKGRLLEDVNNQGAIQASMSLSQLTGREIRVSFPESHLVAIKEIADVMGGEECTVAGMYVGIKGELSAGMLLVIPEANLLMIDDLLHGRPGGTTTKTSEVDLSGISEMGNILASCFINAMADATRLPLVPEVPEISIDMCLPVIDSVLARFNQPGDRLLLTEAVIYGEGMDNVVCHQILFLEPDSLRTLIDALAAPHPRQERKPALVAG
jgi:chemotaxis protein CheC